MTPAPAPVIILFPTPSMGTGYLRRVDRPWPAPKPVRLPRHPPHPIPTVNRRELRERVAQFLKQNQSQRDALKAAHYAGCFQ
jgi:hypothetical protein